MDSPTNPQVPQYAPNYRNNLANLNLDEEVKLFTNQGERQVRQHGRPVFHHHSITADEYTPQCANLIAKYKTTMNFLSDSVDNLEAFMNDYKLSCPAAVNRFKIGVPATYEHAIGDNTKDVAQSVLHFITLMDTLRLNRYAVDELHPILADLIQSLNNVPGLSADFEGKQKVRQWLITLHSMKASDEITEEQARQMLFEMDQSHSEFHRLLNGASA
ncbi:VPS28 protein-domain-containing protein [Mucor lusitanicus]